MDKIKDPNENKLKALLKKESFYLILFVCICVIATITGIVVTRNNSNKTIETSVEETEDKAAASTAISNSTLVKKSASEIAANASEDKVTFTKPIDGKVIIPYLGVDGMYPTKEGSKSTLGVYIEAKEEQKVVSAAKGKVEYVGEDVKGNGTIVIIDHENGYKTIYGNLSKALVEANSTVEEKQEIGITGNSSKYTHTFKELEQCPTALYLQVLKKDSESKYVDVNPKDYIKDLEVAG
ncbi:peptidoglycan DD-metalloendopeptidase family protein [Clostridium cellulovorans]|uniref:Peptidase M23 n=1 Tax=Clostridium cellulovorans (strain ATCC 35296 / DSM 3052 / OCM 3 / 743B) TaxID=573061 RepID=D9STK0_CLOC7|nr:peptidoglycan DD-metalloendopeptidase family protein [Clostridium cellulovorans]ADL52734.1 Peptidase M23 [Clostridium cellulovorans 743B]